MSYKRLEPDVALFDTVESVVADFEDFPAAEAEVLGADIAGGCSTISSSVVGARGS